MTEPTTAVSLPMLLARNVERRANAIAYREKEYGIWQTWTWAEAQEEVDALAKGLLLLGANRGDYIAVIGRNRPAMYWAGIAAQKAGCIPVPLYQDASAEELAYALEHCGARFVIAGDQEQVDKVGEVSDQLSNLDHVVYLDGRGLRKYDHSKMSAYTELQKMGREQGDTDELARRTAELTADSTCVMLYTSGTTSRLLCQLP